jgi:hypothetical protein
MSNARQLLALSALLVFPAAASASQWQVDAAAGCPGVGTSLAPFCTIQSALDAAASGDEIVVAPGLYLERLDFRGKDVLLHSSGGAAATVIDAGGVGSVVTFSSGEGPGAVLRGFTLRAGAGTDTGAPYEPLAGGGIFCRDASPTIEGNVIEACAANRGGGLALLGGAPLVKGNTIRGNFATHGLGVHCAEGTGALLLGNDIVSNVNYGSGGGGIDVHEAAPTIEDNLIQGNRCSFAGGISVQSTLAVVIRRNRILGNSTDEDDAGGLYTSANTLVEENEISGNSAMGYGGGVVAYGGTFRRNRITGNRGWESGGVVALPGATFDGDLFEDNNVGVFVDGRIGEPPIVLSRVTVRANGGYSGGLGISVVHGELVVEDSLVAGNVEGLMATGPGTDVTVRRCTFSGNEYSAVVTFDGAHASVADSIVWGNAASTGLELAPETGTIDASWSIVRLGYPGTENLDIDPLFVDPAHGDFTLRSDSPAVDSGDPAASTRCADLAAHPRQLDGDLDRTRILDRGAYEFDHAQVTITTDAKPGGALTLDITGTSGLVSVPIVGLETGAIDWPPFGILFVDLSASAWILPVAPLPIRMSGTIPSDFPDGMTLVFQAVAVLPANGAGNLSNVSIVTVRQP